MRRQDKYPDTEMFKYMNLNPHNRITLDCVVRAIAMAMASKRGVATERRGKNMWAVVLNDLSDFSEQTGYFMTDTKCYSRYLQQCGFVEWSQPRHSDGTKYTLREFIAKNPKGIFLVNMPGHLTVVVDGVNYDIWDCTKSGSKIGKVWESKK